MEFRDAVMKVLRDEGGELHWTVIQDLALTRGYLDPFTQPQIRKGVLAALAEAVRAGDIERRGTGVYALPGV
jgi:hypothetical protein